MSRPTLSSHTTTRARSGPRSRDESRRWRRPFRPAAGVPRVRAERRWRASRSARSRRRNDLAIIRDAEVLNGKRLQGARNGLRLDRDLVRRRLLADLIKPRQAHDHVNAAGSNAFPRLLEGFASARHDAGLSRRGARARRGRRSRDGSRGASRPRPPRRRSRRAAGRRRWGRSRSRRRRAAPPR